MRRAHFSLVHRRTRTAFSRRSVAVAAVLARELAISLVFRVLALELLEARKRFGLELLLLDAFLVKGIVPGKTAVPMDPLSEAERRESHRRERTSRALSREWREHASRVPSPA